MTRETNYKNYIEELERENSELKSGNTNQLYGEKIDDTIQLYREKINDICLWT